MLNYLKKLIQGDASICAGRAMKIVFPLLLLIFVLFLVMLFGGDGFITKALIVVLSIVLVLFAFTALLNSIRGLLFANALPMELKAYTYRRTLLGFTISTVELLVGLLILL